MSPVRPRENAAAGLQTASNQPDRHPDDDQDLRRLRPSAGGHRPGRKTASYGYNAAGNRIRRIDPDGRVMLHASTS